ncbi:MAG: response regulator transcription factor, partial [Firmicutes bacterium]|nr:response regulator transcription factor [Bacillota bacterium]
QGALAAGARGYLLKRVSPEDLLGAIRQVAAGRTVLDPEVHPFARGKGSAPALTGRERDVLEQILAGRANKEIAAALGISERTVKGHVSALLAKLGCQDRTQIVIAAYRLGLGRERG